MRLLFLALIPLFILTACRDNGSEKVRDAAVSTSNNEGIDPYIQCVIGIRDIQLTYSFKRREHEKQKAKDHKFEVEVGKLSDNNYPVIPKTFARGTDEQPAVIYLFSPSYETCENSKQYLSKLHQKTYGTEAIFRDSSMFEYASILRGE